MYDVVKELNYNTISKEQGIQTDTTAMNHFCELIFRISQEQSLQKENYQNRLEWISCYEGLNLELRKQVEEKKQELANGLVQTYEEGPRVK